MADTQKFMRWANALYILTGVSIIFLAGVLLMQLVLHPPSAATAADYFDSHFIAPDITTTQVWLAMGIGIMAFVAFIWTLTTVWRLLDHYRKGRVLTFESAQLILRIGQGVAVVGLLRIVGFSVQSVLLSMAAPEGQRQLAVGINSSDVGLLLAGGLFTVIGWAMRDAALVAAENKAIV